MEKLIICICYRRFIGTLAFFYGLTCFEVPWNQNEVLVTRLHYEMQIWLMKEASAWSKRIGVASLTFCRHMTSSVTWPLNFDIHKPFPFGDPLEPSLCLTVSEHSFLVYLLEPTLGLGK